MFDTRYQIQSPQFSPVFQSEEKYATTSIRSQILLMTHYTQSHGKRDHWKSSCRYHKGWQ